MRTKRLLLWLYLIFLVTILAQAGWWLVYLRREGEHYLNLQIQRMRTDQLHAAYLLQSSREIQADPEGTLGPYFPDLVFRPTPTGTDIRIDPDAERAIRSEAARRRRMFFWEGGFFLTLLLAGASMVYVAYRREHAFRRSRELFLAGVTHEFKTPLASLSLYGETLERPELDAAQRERILGHMGEDLQRLRLMVEHVLAVSRAESPAALHLAVLDPAALAQQVLRDLSGLAAREGAEIRTELPEGERVRADETALATALRNLLLNAIHYSPPPARIALRIARDGRWLRLAVSDEGPGIPRREQKRIFQSFYRIGEAGRRPAGIHGSGLGLYLVKRNLEAMGGRVELESAPGAGSTFTLVLPALATDTGD